MQHWNLRKDQAWRSVGLAAIAFFVLTLGFSLHRYFSFYVTTDHGIFNQVFWNSLHGDLFQSSLSSVLSTNVLHNNELPTVFYHRLGQHFTPALLLWLPLYALIPSPATLIGLQVALVTLAGLVLYGLARHRLEAPVAAAIALSYYAANAVIGPALGNFYDLCQLPLFLFGLLWAMETQRWRVMALLTALVLAIREDTGVVLLGIGAYQIFQRWKSPVGWLLCAVSVLYMGLVTTQVMPLFSQDISQRFMIERFGQFVEDENASTIEVIRAMLSDPWLLVREWISPVPETVNYLLGHWLPLAFISAIAPAAWVMTLLPITQIFLQHGEVPLSINVRYATAVIPGLFYGTILWWSHHPSWFQRPLRQFWLGCLCLSLLFTFTSNPHRSWSFLLPDSFDPLVYISPMRQAEHTQALRSLLSQVPADASVSASRYILAHVSGRRAVLPFGRYPRLDYINDTINNSETVAPVDYVIADLWFPQQYQPAFRDAEQEVRQYRRQLDRLLKRNHYGLIDFQDGVALLKRGATSETIAQVAWEEFRQTLESG